MYLITQHEYYVCDVEYALKVNQGHLMSKYEISLLIENVQQVVDNMSTCKVIRA